MGDAGTRLALVLLPEPGPDAARREAAADPWASGPRGETVAGVDPGPAVARRSGGLASLHLADAAALIEVPAWLAATPTGGPGGPPGWGAPRDPLPAPGTALRTARRLTFFSLGGGTGKTTLAVEVAGLLADRGRRRTGRGAALPRVALVDLDLTSPRAGLRLGVSAPTDWDLAETDIAGPAVGRLLAVHASGLQVLPGPASLLPSDATDRPDVVRRLAAAIAALEARGCDTVVLDVAGDLSALTRWALEDAQDIFVVLTPTAGGIQDAYRSTQALRRLGLRHRLRYVVNRHRGEPAPRRGHGRPGRHRDRRGPRRPRPGACRDGAPAGGSGGLGGAPLRPCVPWPPASTRGWSPVRPRPRPPLLAGILRRRAG